MALNDEHCTRCGKFVPDFRFYLRGEGPLCYECFVAKSGERVPLTEYPRFHAVPELFSLS
jgi:recombinational DNA repair protein (RecF pathway)